MLNKLWVEAYRPDTLKGYVFQNPKNAEIIKEFIAKQSIPHLVLSGSPGTGKTTLAFILKNELGVEDGDFKVLNASDDNSIDTIRGAIKSFVQVMPIGDLRIVLLDEADYLTRQAQSALRRIMEEYSDTVRFILTCNEPHKIIPAIYDSRCTHLQLSEFDKGDMTVHAYKILKKEGIVLKVDDELQLLKDYVEDAHPDMRKLIQSLESNIIDGKLQDQMELSGMDVKLVDITNQLNEGKWMEAREGIIATVEDHEWEEVYRLLYDNIDQVKGFDQNSTAWKQAIVIIADHLRHHFAVADPEINFSACMIKLSGLVK